jgi:hypothetical protein
MTEMSTATTGMSDVVKRSAGTWVMAGAVGVLLLMVPSAFVVGLRVGRTLGRLRGY